MLCLDVFSSEWIRKLSCRKLVTDAAGRGPAGGCRAGDLPEVVQPWLSSGRCV